MFIDYTGFTFCSLILKFNARNINSYKIIKTCFWKSVSSKWLTFRRLRFKNSLTLKKKRRHSFDSDNSRKIIKSFKSRHWNEKLNSTNRKQKKQIKDDRNRRTATEIEFKRKTFFKSTRIRKSRNEIQKIEIAREVVSK